MSDFQSMTVGARLRLTRGALGFGGRQQAKFAAGAGIPPTQFNNWENDKRAPKIEAAIALCKTYSLTMDWIYRGELSGLPLQIAEKIRRGSSGAPPQMGPAPNHPARRAFAL
jgi:DNA-binding XRE family transcriptional regulator